MSIHQYQNPPIMEAVCELRFAPGSDWDLSYPWLYYEKIKSTYVGKPREQKLLSLEPNATGSPSVIEQSKIQFPMEGDTGLLAIGQDVLSVHVNRPYPGWNAFRSRIESALKEYVVVASPIGLRNIGLRYINQVIIPGAQTNVADYFIFPPANILPLECSVDNFMCRNEYIYKDEPIRFALAFARTEPPAGMEGISAYLLDVDMTWQWPSEPLSIESAMNKVDELRRRERIIFEGLVTDKARGIFDAE